MTRIAVVCPYSLAVPGGVQGQALGLAEAYASLGHEVLLMAPEALAVAPPAPPRGALELVDLGTTMQVRANGSLAPVPWSPAALMATRRALRRYRPELVHLHEPILPGPALEALVVSRQARQIATFHRAGADRWYRAWGRVVGRLLPGSLALTAVSPEARSTAADVLGRSPSTIALLWNGVDSRRFSKAAPWPTSAPTVMFLGRHEARKGADILLSAVTGWPEHLQIWIAGEGRSTPSLRQRAALDDRVHFLGRIDEAEKASRLAGADCFCAPALRGESFGVVLLEAMAAGCAVVASDLPGYRDAGGDVVRYVPPGDPAALRATLGEILCDAPLRKRLGELGRRRAAAFGFTALAHRYLAIGLEGASAASGRGLHHSPREALEGSSSDLDCRGGAA